MQAVGRPLRTALLASLMIHSAAAALAQRWAWGPSAAPLPPQPLTVTLRPETRPRVRPLVPPPPVPRTVRPRRAVPDPAPVAAPSPPPTEEKRAVPAPALLALNEPAKSAQSTMVPAPAAQMQAIPPAAKGKQAAATVPAVALPDTPPRFDAAYLDNPIPSYPALARRRGIEGVVRLEALVGSDGRPREVRLGGSSGSALLDEAALAAVRAWRFVPARRGAESVEDWVVVPVRFHLSQLDG